MLPGDESACGYYRMRLPAGAVALETGWTVDVYRPSEVRLGTGPTGRLWKVFGLDLEDVSVIVMQRVSSPEHVEFLRWLQGRGVAVVVDVDDAMWAIERDNAAWKAWNSNGRSHWRWLDKACGLADLVTVTTAALAARYGRHGRVVELPNCVPSDVAQIPSVRDQVDQTTAIGWAGFTATHPGDLQVVGSAVADCREATGCEVRVIGDAHGAATAWGTPVQGVDPVPIGAQYFAALTTLDVGLVPLRGHRFNRSKSYLKALEMAACGVPVIASPTPAHLDLRRTVDIGIASTVSGWRDGLISLVTDADLRAERGAAIRDQVMANHTYEGHAYRWADAWQRARTRRERMSR